MKFTHPFLQKLLNYENLKALIYENQEYSYKDLLLKTEEKITQIQNATQERILGIVGDFNADCIAFLLACVELKKIVVPFSDENEIENKLKEAGISVYFKENDFIFKEYSPSSHKLLKDLKEAGLILFSSGSTGKPKAILHNLNTLLESYLSKKAKNMNILLFLMFDHIGGLNTLFNCLSIGACGVAIKDRKNVDSLAFSIEKYKISLLPASPSLLNLMLCSKVHERYKLSSLKLITYGTEKMPDSLLKRLKAEFKGVRFHQTFGTSEVGIAQTKTYENFIKLENIDYKIIDNELYLKSKTQSLGYLNASNEAFRADGYFATGDLVELVKINGEEYLKIIGRNKELINVGGEKVMPEEVENVLLEFDFIADCLVFAKANALTGQSVAAKIVLKEGFCFDSLELKKKIKALCKDKLAPYKIPSKIEIVERLQMSNRFKKVRK
ncbi:ANL family adenylate-forming protein [Campylobacter cuniculorum]|uniref:ANL family adenylate-forming protein n=1 Tax=Campylobacter cuniculorum TaxID=374106 RepID=UPI0023F13B03|nr:fatty acid--CoA ligase family protein [Campylobacter cuniculorum]